MHSITDGANELARVWPVTADWLKRDRPCAEQFAAFVRLFGRSAALTRANLARAAASGELDLEWLAERILTPASSEIFCEATAFAHRVSQKAQAPAEQSYQAAKEAAYRAYLAAPAGERALQVALRAAERAYREALAPVERAYREATATALADALGLPAGVPVTSGMFN